MSIAGTSTAFGLGFVYFIASVPAGMAAGAGAWTAAIAAWLGYTAGGAVVLVAGAPLRSWLVRKLRIPAERDTSKFIWRAWDRWGLAGLALLAPVTIGPQATAIIALAVGEKWPRILAAVSLGVLPWSVMFASFAAFGINWTK